MFRSPELPALGIPGSVSPERPCQKLQNFLWRIPWASGVGFLNFLSKTPEQLPLSGIQNSLCQESSELPVSKHSGTSGCGTKNFPCQEVPQLPEQNSALPVSPETPKRKCAGSAVTFDLTLTRMSTPEMSLALGREADRGLDESDDHVDEETSRMWEAGSFQESSPSKAQIFTVRYIIPAVHTPDCIRRRITKPI